METQSCRFSEDPHQCYFSIVTSSIARTFQTSNILRIFSNFVSPHFSFFQVKTPPSPFSAVLLNYFQHNAAESRHASSLWSTFNLRSCVKNTPVVPKGKSSLMSTKGGVWYWCSDWQWAHHGTAPLLLPALLSPLDPTALPQGAALLCCSLTGLPQPLFYPIDLQLLSRWEY